MVTTAGYVYCRINTVNGKVYVGQCSREGDPRWSECVSEAKQGRGYRLGAAIRKYGEEVFRKETLYLAKTQHELDMMERFFIILHQSHVTGYNVTLGGEGNTSPRTQEVRDKIRKSILALPEEVRRKKKPPRSFEHCRKIALSRVNFRHTELAKEKNRVGTVHLWKDPSYREKQHTSRLGVRRRAQMRVCYNCFHSFRIPDNRDRIFCSQKCSVENWRVMRCL